MTCFGIESLGICCRQSCSTSFRLFILKKVSCQQLNYFSIFFNVKKNNTLLIIFQPTKKMVKISQIENGFVSCVKSFFTCLLCRQMETTTSAFLTGNSKMYFYFSRWYFSKGKLTACSFVNLYDFFLT